MNNYKFRGKTASNWPGEWVYGFLVKDYRQSYIYNGDNGDFSDCGGVPIEDLHGVIPETVGQWTGLLDKNGKEIYEGDIIKKRTSISLVSNDFFYDACDFLYKGFFLEKIKSAYGYCLEFEKTNPEYEIIGNKIDNPELLEGK